MAEAPRGDFSRSAPGGAPRGPPAPKLPERVAPSLWQSSPRWPSRRVPPGEPPKRSRRALAAANTASSRAPLLHPTPPPRGLAARKLNPLSGGPGKGGRSPSRGNPPSAGWEGPKPPRGPTPSRPPTSPPGGRGFPGPGARPTPPGARRPAPTPGRRPWPPPRSRWLTR